MSFPLFKNCLKFSFSTLFLLFFQPGNAQSLPVSALDELVARSQKQFNTDVVLLVGNKDTVLYQKDTRAFSAVRGQAPIGASSQWLTAALVLQAVDEGKVSLDDKVARYLPAFKSYMKNYLTLRHCLSHFSGIQAEPSSRALRLLEKKKFESLEEEVNAYAAKPIQNNAGEVFRYNNMGPEIAARVLEVEYKKKFEMIAQQKLFRPLMMRQTSFANPAGGPTDAAEGARSSASDYMHFLTMLLNKGMYKGQLVLSENAVEELRRIETKPELIQAAPEATKGYAYTLGAWAPEQTDKGEALEETAPSFGGTLPVVDFARGYAYILLLKDLRADVKTDNYKEMKELLDGSFAQKK